MKLGRWIVLTLVTFFASYSISAYQFNQPQHPKHNAVLLAQTVQDSASNLNASSLVDSSTPQSHIGLDTFNQVVRTAPILKNSAIDSTSQAWLLEFPQHWVQNGECQVIGTLKTILIQSEDKLSGRLHWVWNGQNDAATFTGTLSNHTVQLQMTPPQIGGFTIVFKGKTSASGRLEGSALAKSVCSGKNGTFTLRPLSRPQQPLQAKAIPLFEKPFDDEYLISNYFDHDQPRQFVDNNGYLTNWKGEHLSLGNPGAGIDGHGGYDWGVPENTPLKAVADGVVTFAGEGSPFFCPPLNRDTTGKYVYVTHTAPNGEQFETEYVHLSQVNVEKGSLVSTGDILGLSGNTGCSTGPHLHFGVRRILTHSKNSRTLVDPYGWNSKQQDPWSTYKTGNESIWLWKVNQAPILYEYGR